MAQTYAQLAVGNNVTFDHCASSPTARVVKLDSDSELALCQYFDTQKAVHTEWFRPDNLTKV